MDPALIFFIIRGVIRVGTASRKAYEQGVRDKNFKMPPLPVLEADIDVRIQEYFNEERGHARALKMTAAGGPLHQYWIAGPAGGGLKKPPDDDPQAVTRMYESFLTAMADIRRQRADAAATKAGSTYVANWINLCAFDQEIPGTIEVLEQWSPDAQPVLPWARVALALADVALDFVGSNPGIVGEGSGGEKLLKAICANLQTWIPKIEDGRQAFFVERMGAALLQSGLQALSDNAGTLLTDKAASAFVGKMATPLAELFAAAVKAEKPVDQLTLMVVRDTVFPKMVSAGLEVLVEHQKSVLGAAFDPDDTLGYFTRGFLQALSAQPVTKLGSAEAWLPIYKSLLRAAAAKPGLIVKGADNDANAAVFRKLITEVATTLADEPWPYTADTAIDLGVIVIEAVQKELPNRTSDPWVLLIPSALDAVVKGLRAGGDSFKKLTQPDVGAILRVILTRAAATPGMLVPGASTEVQLIVTAVATAMAQDDKFLISADGWTTIAATAAAAAARNPGKLFGISSATPEGELAAKLITRVLASASTSFTNAAEMRSKGVVLVGETLVMAIEDTLTAAAGNARGALDNIDKITLLVDQLNDMVVVDRNMGKTKSGKNPIGAADWNWLFRNLIADVFEKGLDKYDEQELRNMLLHKPA